MPGYGPAHLLAESTVVPACNVLSPGIDRIYFWIYGSKMVVLVLPGPRDEPFWGIKAARAGGRRGCGQRLAEGELGPVRSTDPEAHPNSRAQPPCPRGPEPLKLGTKLGSGGDSRRQARLREDAGGGAPPGVPPPGEPAADGARGDARVCHAIRRVRAEDDQEEKRSLLPFGAVPVLGGSGPSTSPFPPLPLQPEWIGDRSGPFAARSRSPTPPAGKDWASGARDPDFEAICGMEREGFGTVSCFGVLENSSADCGDMEIHDDRWYSHLLAVELVLLLLLSHQSLPNSRAARSRPRVALRVRSTYTLSHPLDLR